MRKVSQLTKGFDADLALAKELIRYVSTLEEQIANCELSWHALCFQLSLAW